MGGGISIVANRYRAFAVAIGVSCNPTARPKFTAAGFGPRLGDLTSVYNFLNGVR